MSDDLLAHHPLGASAAERWINCPGSVLATIDLPDVDTEYAIEGTAAHTLAERARHEGKPVADYVGWQIPVELTDKTITHVECTKEMAGHIQGFIDYLSALPGDDYNEERAFVGEYVPGAFGTMDAAKAELTHAFIPDLKFGAGIEVDAHENPQLMFYALAFYMTHGWLYRLDRFTLVVYQPRRNHVDEWSISLADLLHWAEHVLKPAAVLAMTPGAPFKAGKWCKFCKLRATCATRAKSVFEMNLDELDDLDAAVAKDMPAIPTLTPDQIAAILRRKSQVTAFFKDLNDFAFNEIKNGRRVGDLKFVAGKTSRDWTLPPADIEAELKKQDLDVTKLYSEPELISPAHAEGVFGKALFKPATEKREGGPLAKLIRKNPGKPVLVPGTDPREAMDLSLVNELEELDEAA